MSTTRSTPLLDHLRSVTWHRHAEFEQLPFVMALMNGTLPLESYVGQLRGLAVIFSALEQTLALFRSDVIIRLRPLMKSRFDMLCADLAFFSPGCVPDILPAVRNSLEIAGHIRAYSCTSPNILLGYLYVLEGTIKGNQVHLPDIVRCFNLKSDEGTLFYRGYGACTESHWEEFRAIMSSAADANVHDAIVGAVETYDALERFHKSLYPLVEEDKGFAATGFNPEAGDHPVPQNREKLQAALRAGRRCRDEFSYFERRYGQRGLRFTDSDAAWLAALTGQPADVVAEQVLWLGRVLSARGMPFLLMERQLELLVEELEMLNSGLSTDALKAVVSDLRQRRCRLITQNRFDETCSILRKHLSSSLAINFADLPVIIVAAHLDHLVGMPECMASLLAWLRDVSLMAEAEIVATREILAAMLLDNVKP